MPDKINNQTQDSKDQKQDQTLSAEKYESPSEDKKITPTDVPDIDVDEDENHYDDGTGK